MAARFCRIQANYKKSATGGFIGLGKLLDGARQVHWDSGSRLAKARDSPRSCRYAGRGRIHRDPEILLTEFADEDDTLAYFRTPDPASPLLMDDELKISAMSVLTGERGIV